MVKVLKKNLQLVVFYKHRSLILLMAGHNRRVSTFLLSHSRRLLRDFFCSTANQPVAELSYPSPNKIDQ